MESWSITNVSAYHGIQNNGPVVSQSNHKIFVRSDVQTIVQYNNYISWQHSANTESLHQTQWPSNSDSSVQLAVH